MLDIVYDHVDIDPGIVYSIALDHFHNTFRTIIASGNNTVVSDYKKIDVKTKKLLRTLSSNLEKLK